MHWALETLGLGPDADERAIKRAYAAKLKTTRPEEDPQGFQALNEAYRTALEMRARRRPPSTPVSAAYEDDTPIIEAALDLKEAAADDRIMPSIRMTLEAPPLQRLASMPSPLPVLPQLDPQPEFEAQAFFDELLVRAENESLGGYKSWLEGHEALYSIPLKTSLAAPLARFLDRNPPMTRAHLDTTLAFFGLDTVNDHTMRLQDILHRLRRNARRGETDWDGIMSDNARTYDRDAHRRPQPAGTFIVWPIIVLMLMLSRCVGANRDEYGALQGHQRIHVLAVSQARSG